MDDEGQPASDHIPPIRLDVPRAWRYTPDWVTRGLAAHWPGSVVESVEMDAVDAGTTSRRRLRLTYAEGCGPETVFIKAQGRLGHRLLLGALGMITPEARLFGTGAALLVERPRVFAVGINRPRMDSVILMEDVRNRGAEPNIVTRAVPLESVQRGIAQLAHMHARYWNHLPAQLEWVKPWRVQAGSISLALMSGIQGPPRLREFDAIDLLPTQLRSGRSNIWLLKRAAKFARIGPQTLLHGDTHIGNTYLLPDGDLGFLDWQLIQTGSWARDVGYFMISALSVEERRQNERHLLRYYMDTLGRAGVTIPDWNSMWNAYRVAPAWGIVAWLSTLAARDYQSDAVCLTYIARYCAAYRDLDTESRLKN